MKRTISVIEKYLSDLGRLESPKLGSDDKESKPVTEKDNIELRKSMIKERRFTRNLAVIYIVFVCFYFFIGIFLVLRNLNSPNTVSIIYSVKLFATLFILRKLHKIWHTKTVIDTTITLAAELPPEELVKVIETLYWSTMRKPKK